MAEVDMQELISRVKRLEAEAARFEDERVIRQTLAQLAYFADLGLAERYAGLFTEDGVVDTGSSRFVGRTSIRDDFIAGPDVSQRHGRSMHFAAQIVVDVTGDRARATGYQTVSARTTDGEFPVERASRCLWEFRREGGEWLIYARTSTPIPGAPPFEV